MREQGLGAGDWALGRTRLGTRHSGFEEQGLGTRGWGLEKERQLLAFIILGGILLAGCRAKPGAPAATAFPETNEVAGWSKSGETRTFTAENLYEYIDGAADKFVQAGLVTARTQDYRYQNKLEATADVYTMKTPEGARKVYDSESSPKSPRIALGDIAELSKSSLIFVVGSHYVKLVAYEESPDVGKALTALAQTMQRKLAP